MRIFSPSDVVVLDQQHAATALSGLRRAHHAGGAGADDDDIRRHRQVFSLAAAVGAFLRASRCQSGTSDRAVAITIGGEAVDVDAAIQWEDTGCVPY